ncbi:MAG: FlgD immunoglobulin-like domain containing protein [bacterium]|nr:FlgD immunoglobulin-like domain containing protein [bacterium]
MKIGYRAALLLSAFLVVALPVFSADRPVTASPNVIDPDYSLTVNVYPAGGGSVAKNPDKTAYTPGEIVQLTPSPAAGFYFWKWEGDTTSTDSLLSLPMWKSRSVTAKFLAFYKLTMHVEPPGTGTTHPDPETDRWYRQEAVVPIEAVPAAGYKFVQWHCWVADFYSASTTVTMHGDENVTAEFAPLKVTLTLAVNPPEGGTTDPAPGDHLVDNGSNPEIRAVPAAGYRFVRWDCPVADRYNAVTTVAMNQNETVTAVFEKIRYTLDIRLKNDGGGTLPPAGVHQFDPGSVVELEAKPDADHRFERWHGPVADASVPKTTVQMDADKTVWVEFARNSHELWMIAEPAEGGTLDPAAGGHTVSRGEWVPVSATAAPGWVFLRWEGGVKNPSSAATEVFINGDKTLKAFFAPDFKTLTLRCDPESGGWIVPAKGAHRFRTGERVEIEASAKPGFAFVAWSGGVEDSTLLKTAVVMDTDREVTARFRVIDEAPPFLTDCYPANGAQFVPRNTKIQFKVRDNGAGVNPGTLTAWVNGTAVIENGESAGASVSRSGKKITVVYHPDEPFSNGAAVTVRVAADDAASPAHHLDSTFTFSIGLANVDTLVSVPVDTAGGLVSHAESGLELNIPGNALGSEIEISIQKPDTLPPLPEDVNGMALAVHFGPDGLQFEDWVTVRVPYTQDDLDRAGVSDPAELKIWYYHTLNGKWSQLETESVDPVGRYIFVKVREFCYLTLAGPSTPSSADGRADGSRLPGRIWLSHNYPNPFNPSTRFYFETPAAGDVRVAVLDASGRQVRVLANGFRGAGRHEFEWDAKDDGGNGVPTGSYFLLMKSKTGQFIRKMTYVK